MCGLFGVVRSPFAGDPGRASDVFVTLGALAEERGTDAAGVALLGGWPGLAHDGCRVVKGRGRFSGVWRTELLAELDRAPVAMGHTRWATQGSPAEAANASPMLVAAPGARSAGIVGTHNGDVDAGALRERFALPALSGGTDSEAVFQLLAGRRGSSGVTAALEALTGRTALAWVDRDAPAQVHLARAALSPLAVAVDSEQNIYWASNPRWFRVAQRCTRVRFATIVMLREGTYLRVGTERAPGRRDRPRVLAAASFVPTARPADRDDRVWTGFTDADRARDQATLLHRLTTPDLTPVA
ncbi:class II glutamine amidotransferase [Actinomadura verrucosospora]|uniref:class II glutamine amidotransferase n=1 Tax=Actinomadura verrucosospora TaxID=46165 RepID=UPI0015632EDC|nr:hypothetical protein [Actinomadura verrucosospora]